MTQQTLCCFVTGKEVLVIHKLSTVAPPAADPIKLPRRNCVSYLFVLIFSTNAQRLVD